MSEYEAYIDGQYTLQDGEYADSNSESIVTVENPNSTYYEWDSENNEWALTEEKQEEWETAVLAKLAAYRYSVQSSTLFSSGDFTSYGSSNSYLYVDQTYSKIAGGIIEDTRWKNADGRTWITLDADSLADFKTMRDNLAVFVDECFKAEETVQIALLEDLTINYEESFDTILAS
jgi:hypothetical protein